MRILDMKGLCHPHRKEQVQRRGGREAAGGPLSPQALTECLSGAKGCSWRCSGGQADQALALRELTVQEGNTWKSGLGVMKGKHDSHGGAWTPAAWGRCPQ